MRGALPDLIERLPKPAEVFAAGDVDLQMVGAALFRTVLITDQDVLIVVGERLVCSGSGGTRKWSTVVDTARARR